MGEYLQKYLAICPRTYFELCIIVVRVYNKVNDTSDVLNWVLNALCFMKSVQKDIFPTPLYYQTDANSIEGRV